MIALIDPHRFESVRLKAFLKLICKSNGFILRLVKIMTVTAGQAKALIIKHCLLHSNSRSSVNKQTKWPGVELIFSSSCVL